MDLRPAILTFIVTFSLPSLGADKFGGFVCQHFVSRTGNSCTKSAEEKELHLLRSKLKQGYWICDHVGSTPVQRDCAKYQLALLEKRVEALKRKNTSRGNSVQTCDEAWLRYRNDFCSERTKSLASVARRFEELRCAIFLTAHRIRDLQFFQCDYIGDSAQDIAEKCRSLAESWLQPYPLGLMLDQRNLPKPHGFFQRN